MLHEDEYARFAGVYDGLLYGFLEPVRLRIAHVLLRRGAASALDVCCGTARQAILLERAGIGRVAGTDASPAMLSQARAKWPDGTLSLADAAHLPHADNTFDAAVLSFALHEKPSRAREDILDDALRVVRPGGVLAVADYRAPKTFPVQCAHLPVAVVERLAGREHHAHYRDYLARGGTSALLATRPLRVERDTLFLFGAVGLYLAEKN